MARQFRVTDRPHPRLVGLTTMRRSTTSGWAGYRWGTGYGLAGLRALASRETGRGSGGLAGSLDVLSTGPPRLTASLNQMRRLDLAASRRVFWDVPDLTADDLVTMAAQVDLRGRGGAAFPLADKIAAVQEAARRPRVPAGRKDAGRAGGRPPAQAPAHGRRQRRRERPGQRQGPGAAAQVALPGARRSSGRGSGTAGPADPGRYRGRPSGAVGQRGRGGRPGARAPGARDGGARPVRVRRVRRADQRHERAPAAASLTPDPRQPPRAWGAADPAEQRGDVRAACGAGHARARGVRHDR